MLSRITVAICVSMAGVGDKGRLLSGGTGFLAISSIKFLDLIIFDWHDYSCGIFPMNFVIQGFDETRKRLGACAVHRKMFSD